MRKLSNLPYGLVVVLLVLSLMPVGAPLAANLETQTNREDSVTVKVTPRNISPGAKSWDFEITLTTHTVSLDQDMGRAAVLVFGSGKQPPLAWEGDPPGGHHRKGVLRFQPPSVLPQFVELHISGIGDVSPRVFRWRLAE